MRYLIYLLMAIVFVKCGTTTELKTVKPEIQKVRPTPYSNTWIIHDTLIVEWVYKKKMPAAVYEFDLLNKLLIDVIEKDEIFYPLSTMLTKINPNVISKPAIRNLRALMVYELFEQLESKMRDYLWIINDSNQFKVQLIIPKKDLHIDVMQNDLILYPSNFINEYANNKNKLGYIITDLQTYTPTAEELFDRIQDVIKDDFTSSNEIGQNALIGEFYGGGSSFFDNLDLQEEGQSISELQHYLSGFTFNPKIRDSKSPSEQLSKTDFNFLSDTNILDLKINKQLLLFTENQTANVSQLIYNFNHYNVQSFTVSKMGKVAAYLWAGKLMKMGLSSKFLVYVAISETGQYNLGEILSGVEFILMDIQNDFKKEFGEYVNVNTPKQFNLETDNKGAIALFIHLIPYYSENSSNYELVSRFRKKLNEIKIEDNIMRILPKNVNIQKLNIGNSFQLFGIGIE